MAFCWNFWPVGPWRGADADLKIGRPNRGKRRNVKAARKARRRNQ